MIHSTLMLIGALVLAPVARAGSEEDKLKAVIGSYAGKATLDKDAAKTMLQLADLFVKKRRFAEAEPLILKILSLAEHENEPAHPVISVLLARLAFLCVAQGKYDQANLHNNRALEIVEKAYGPSHPEVAAVLSAQARTYLIQGRFGEAEKLLKRALAIYEQVRGPEHQDVANALDALASIYLQQGAHDQTEPILIRAYTIRRKMLNLDHPDLASSLGYLAQLYWVRGDYEKALPLAKQSLEILEKSYGDGHPSLVTGLNDLAMINQALGHYDQARLHFLRAAEIYERNAEPEHADLATILSNIAQIDIIQGHYDQANILNQRALTIRERILGANHKDTALSLNNLAYVYQIQGQYGQAESLLQRALLIFQNVLDEGHAYVALSLNNLAEVYRLQGRIDEAIPLNRRALSIREKIFGLHHPDVAMSLNNLAGNYLKIGRNDLAEPLFKRSIAINEKLLGTDHPAIATSLSNLAQVCQALNRFDEAEQLFERAAAIHEKVLGHDHPDLARSLNNLAGIYADQGKFESARELYLRSLAIYERALGADHPDVVTSLQALAIFELAQEKASYKESLQYSRRLFSILRKRFEQLPVQGLGAMAERKSWRNAIALHVGNLKMVEVMDDASSIDHALSFEAAQMALFTDIGQIVAQTAARFANQGGQLASAIREYQDTLNRRDALEKEHHGAISLPQGKTDVLLVKRLRLQIDELNKVSSEQSKAIQIRFPEYHALLNSMPVAPKDVQGLLRQDEAIVQYLVDNQGVWAWVVRRDSLTFHWFYSEDAELISVVNQLRAQLDPDKNPTINPYDAGLAHQLYQKIFAPMEQDLAGVKHVIVVSDGPLQSLPLGVLVDQAPEQGKALSWLADRFALSSVPSVSALRALRTFTRAKTSQEPFVGIGDPLLEGESDSASPQTRGKGRKLSLRAVFGMSEQAGKGEALRPGIGIADVNALRKLEPLTDTAAELKAMANTLGAPGASLYLQANASETQVKQTDLSKYRILAFATHGVMSGEISGIAEPGLVLTPPKEGTLEDDGYLSASEVAQLKLNADWVILSACNTAAPDGTPGAEGLSGLAKAFFYAGAKSLLVSNWYVDSTAAVHLTTGMLKRHAENPKMGKAEALRQSMQELRKDPDFSHPMMWAPFMVVGEGG